MATAKSRALDVFRRERTARTFAPELSRLLQSEWTLAPTLEEEFSPHAIKDDQLRMMFSCCHPRLPEEAQVALILHILCGLAWTRLPARSSARTRRWESASPELRKCSQARRSCLTLRTPAIS